MIIITERALIMELLNFSDVIQTVVFTLLPNRLCDYLYEISVKFSDFVTRCQVSFCIKKIILNKLKNRC